MVQDAGLLGRITIDSAGTHGYHVGEPPDARAVGAAARRGYDLSGLRARKFERVDFHHFGLVLAMDRDNHEILARLAQPSSGHRLRMMMEYARQFRETEVPDPYYGGPEAFERVLDIVEDAAQGLLESIRAELK